MESQNWFVYIIQSENGHYYTGITTNLDRRFQEHLSSSRGAKYFRKSAPVQIVFHKRFMNRSEASKYEYYIKSLKRAQKIELINSEGI